jgi:hypothetical protein
MDGGRCKLDTDELGRKRSGGSAKRRQEAAAVGRIELRLHLI